MTARENKVHLKMYKTGNANREQVKSRIFENSYDANGALPSESYLFIFPFF